MAAIQLFISLTERPTLSFSNLGIPPASRPYPAWKPLLIETVEKAICLAWDKVRTEHPDLIARADEDYLTDQVKSELVALRRANKPAGFNDFVFGIPMRDAKARDGSGHSIDTMPDLTISLANCRREVDDDQHDALFFECKVLVPKRGLALYDKNGIQRFVTGWYASRMPHAGLIAYALDPMHKCPTLSLIPYLKRKERVTKITHAVGMKCTSGPTKVLAAPGPMAGDISETVHTRNFLQTSPALPGDIALRHLWLLP